MEKLFKQIDELNNNDFEQLINHVDKQRRRRAKDILSEAQRQAARFIQDMDGKVSSRATELRRPKPPRFANPNDASQTWSGFGRQPEWVKNHLTNGGKLEDLAIS